jgi:signal peptidase I
VAHRSLTPSRPALAATPLTRRRGRRRLATAATALAVTLTVLVGASVAGLLPVRLMRVDAGSMEPALSAGDLVLVDHGVEGLRRRDVVAAHHPVTGASLVKRVVGFPGDRIALEDGVLVVNGEPQCEPGIDPDRLDGVWFGPVTVPDGTLFLLGDARADSIDSRAFGAVPLDDVVGVVRGRVWPSPGALPSPRC